MATDKEIEAEMRNIADLRIAESLHKKGLDSPFGYQRVVIENKSYTIEDLVDHYLIAHGDKIRAEAIRNLEAEGKPSPLGDE
jgi:hypothetical protein